MSENQSFCYKLKNLFETMNRYESRIARGLLGKTVDKL